MHPRVAPPVAVLFDVGNTLLAEDRFDLRAGIRAVVPADERLVAALAREFEHAARAAIAEQREISLADWLVRRASRGDGFALGAPVHALEDAIWRAVVRLVPRPGALAMLHRLREDGVPTAAVSNAAFSGRVLGAELARHGFGGLLEFTLSSADIGRRKPAAALFEVALGQLGTDPGRTWFVGDTLADDIAGAAAAGLMPIWLQQGGGDVSSEVPAVHIPDWGALLRLYEDARSSAPAG